MSLKRIGFLGGAFAVVALLAISGSAAAAAKEFTVTGHQNDAGEYWFEFEGIDGENPTVGLDPGDEVTITYTTDLGVHNVRVGKPIEKQTEIIGEGDEAQVLTFTVPEDAAGTKIDYFCVPHKSFKMMGVFQVSGEAAEPPADKPAPGFGGALAGLAVLGAVLVLRRK